MRVSLIKKKKITNLILPSVINGSYWISDVDSNGIKRNLILIEAENNNWKLISNKEVYIVNDNSNLPYVYLNLGKFYTIHNDVEDTDLIIYCSKAQNEYLYYDVTDIINQGITIGSNENDFVCLKDLENIISIHKDNNKIFIVDNSRSFEDGVDNTAVNSEKNINGVYVNNVRIINEKELNYGDVIFIKGLKLLLLAAQGHTQQVIYLCIEMNDNIAVKYMPLTKVLPAAIEFSEPVEELEYPLYDEKDYFHKKPRFVTDIKPLEINVDAPPGKVEEQNTSFLLTVGPMITMSMTSLVTGFTAVNNVMSGNTTITQATPSLVICAAMFASIFIWPLFTKKYEKRQRKKTEAKRQAKYSEYIEEKKQKIGEAITEQENILKQKYPSVNSCVDIILNKKDVLWQRRIEDKDFLEVNLGVGSCPMQIDIKYPEDHFSMVEDNLKEMVNDLGSTPKSLNNVPIPFSFRENFISGLVGEEQISGEYIRRIITQMLAFHSYDDLKIVILTDEDNEYQWKFLKTVPHLFTDDKNLRFFATNNDEYKEICYYLDQIYNIRKENLERHQTEFDQIYLIITDSFKKVRDFDVINKILNNKEYAGFSLFVMDNNINNLPDQVNNFVELSDNIGFLCNNTNIENRIQFTLDILGYIDYEVISKTLANIPIEFNNSNEGQLPAKLGFLEMYDVGKIEQLNALSRWQSSNPMQNLSAPVGIGKNSEKISIDLHEKFHGPHGLIAGMTGSGKSEFIITYILSMAISYHPYEVQFILIDYKGGGLAGAFENSSTGLKLPHLVGTITNLDANEIKRSLASIESELKRRQALFNAAREKSGESTIDIYKYQRMYREKIVDEPMSHLFIISDEFAELKNQQPEFMEQLISTARIGRSLGVHLILATQKPSGVVDPQIWSNTRFRVCMKVQDKSDSNEVIKCPDAAFLKQTGRFYFQVGYNEVFVLGQAAWAGEKYIPSEKVNRTLDTSINFIDNIGYTIKSVDTKEKKNDVIIENKGEELSNIVKYLDDLAKSNNIKCRPLWLAKMSDLIRVEDLQIKYNYQKENYYINPIIGEYDVPTEQEQRLLTLPLSKEGNAIIYGASGSGKENFITTLIYSSMLSYSANEVNYYIIDFGAEVLKMFKSSPIVGDILNSTDEEKIRNLFKMINKTIDERKSLFADFGGDYQNYCKNSGNTVPNIVVVINNYEAYQETFSNLEDDLIVLTRDCNKYGIYFVLTVNTPNGVRIKLRQNISLIYSLQQNNDDDYSTILGNVRKNYPAHIFGRGLVKIDNIYEFQTALVTEKDNIPQAVKAKCEEMSKSATNKAPAIPVLPNKVTYKEIASAFGKTNDVIIGIDKNELIPVGFDFTKGINLISGLDLMTTETFLNPFINQIIALQKSTLYVINCEELNIAEEYQKFYKYYDNNINDVFTELNDYVTAKNDEYIASNYDKNIFNNIKPLTVMILGMDTFKSKLNDENKSQLDKFFDMAQDLNIISFIVVESIDRLKKMEFETWYKNNVNANNGIWVGQGINDQFTIKISQKIPEMREEVPNNFCFVVKKGKVQYVKYVEELKLK